MPTAPDNEANRARLHPQLVEPAERVGQAKRAERTKRAERKEQSLFSPRDMMRLAAVSLIVAWCGAAGASYVLGQGEAAFSPFIITVITLVGAVFFACLSILIDLRYGSWLERGRVEGPRRTEEKLRRANRPQQREKPRQAEGSQPIEAPQHSRASSRLDRLTPRWNRRSTTLFCLVMGVFWLPWLIANYPGGAYWDTYYQIQQVFPENHPISIIPFGDHGKDTVTSAYFCDHHPLFDTLIYGAFAAASQALTGAWNAGTFAFVILQGAATIVALTASVAFLRKLGAPTTLRFAAFAYFCVMPFVSTWAMTMVKDSLFSLVFIPYFMMLVNAVATRGRSLCRPRSIVLFIILGILLCLTKKIGIFVVVPTALVAFVAFAWDSKRWSSLAASKGHRSRNRRQHPKVAEEAVPLGSLALAFGGQAAACLLVMQFLLPWFVFPALDVAPGGRQESLGVALQQTAAFVHEHRDEVTDDEVEAIDAVIPFGRLVDDYDPTCQDGVKYHFRIDASDEAIRDYLAVWAEMGLRHPETYLAAVLAIGGNYLAPCHSLNIRTTTCDTWQGDAHVLYNPESLNWLREGMANLYNNYAELPVVCLPVQTVVWVFWLPALLWLIARRYHPGDGLLFVPGAIVLAFCVIGPIFDARYCLPLLYTVPLLACFTFRERAAEDRGRRRDERIYKGREGGCDG